ncbi:hypothetical protein BpHYR1_010378 [Brachionus plicatilis]|uniref:Peptidase A2 domain-containing protein n=1 Tax=Brachionus plicatilis TaxID=10195 RepID=A0A3M7SVK5_BRAPC|nr:hypothetical protein BpHYR1_010378 [Brachionus plicatilis]
MKQNGSIEEYINQFQLSLNQTSDIDEKMKIRYDQYSSKRPQENLQKYKYNGKNGQGKYYRSDKRKYNNENKRDYLQKISLDDDEMDISAVRIGCLKNFGQQNELKIKGTINGMNAEMLIDTGAQRSVISEKAFQRLKLDISKNVNIEKQLEANLLTIVPYCFTDVLLGADWLIMADAGTWLSRQLVWFGDESEIIKINQNKCVQKFDRFTKYSHKIGRIEELDENIDENLNEIDPFDDYDFSYELNQD